MFISYVFVSDYYNIKNQSFSFDSNFEFSLLTNNTISVKQKSSFHNHINDNIHINAIVGENGTGKSTLLNVLTEILSGKANFMYILILRKGSTFFYNSSLKDFTLKKQIGKGIVTKKINEATLYKLPLSTILYSNVKSKTTWYLNEKVSLLTEKYLSKCSKYDCDYHYGEEISEIDAHELNDISRQISYFSNQDVQYLDVTIPDSLEFEISRSYRQILSEETTPDFYLEFNYLIALEKYHQVSDKQQFIGELYLTFVLSFLREIYHTQESSNHAILDNDIKDLINESLKSELVGIEYFQKFLDNYSRKTFLKKVFKNNLYYNEIEIEKIKTSFLNKKKFIKFIEKHTTDTFISIENHRNLKKLVKLYSESIYKFQYLTLQWLGLSSGENAKLNFYSRIYERIHNKLKTLSGDFSLTENLVVLIDEGATFFHPEWQRSYIYDIISFFENVIIKSSKVDKVHIILTSHSPFVISDLTRDNIIYLRKEKRPDSNFNYCKVLKEEEKPLSFAGNISSLYRNSFFLQDTLTGKYSHLTLDDIINKLVEKNKELNLELVEYIITEISEPIIKKHIEKLLETYKHDKIV